MRIVSSEGGIVAAVRRGDAEAFAALYRTYAPALVSYVERIVKEPAVAQDLVQDLFLALWQRRRAWRVRTSLRAYLFSAARNRARGYFDKQRVRQAWASEQQAMAPRWASPDAAEQVDGEALCEAVARWLDELPNRRREVFELSRYGMLTYQEIATVLGISVKTVEKQMSRSLEHLRKRLAAYERMPPAARAA